MFNTLRFDLKKNVLSPGFVLGIISLLILIFSTKCVVFNGDVKQPNYNYIQFVIYAKKDEIMSTYLYSNVQMFIRGFKNEWLAVFLPMITGMVCVPMLCDELNSNNSRMCIIRSNISNAILSKFCAALLSSILMIIIVVSIFGVFCYICFPSLQEYSFNESELMQYPLNHLFDSQKVYLVVIARVITIIIYSMPPCIVALITGALTLNKFVSLSIPVMGYFALQQIAQAAYTFYDDSKAGLSLICFYDISQRLSCGETEFNRLIDLPLFIFYIYPLVILLIWLAVFYKLMEGRYCG